MRILMPTVVNSQTSPGIHKTPDRYQVIQVCKHNHTYAHTHTHTLSHKYDYDVLAKSLSQYTHNIKDGAVTTDVSILVGHLSNFPLDSS